MLKLTVLATKVYYRNVEYYYLAFTVVDSLTNLVCPLNMFGSCCILATILGILVSIAKYRLDKFDDASVHLLVLL